MEWKLTLLQILESCAGYRQVWKQFVDAAVHQPTLICTRAALVFLLPIPILSVGLTNPYNLDAIFQRLADKSWREWTCFVPLKLGITKRAVDLIHFVTGQDTKTKAIAAEHVSGCCSGKMRSRNIQY